MRLFLSLGIIFMLGVACNTTPDVAQNTPEEAVKGLFTAIKAANFEKAKQYCTASTQESLRDFVTNLNMTNKDEKKELMASYSIEVTKVDCAENAGTMICKLCCSPNGEAEIEMIQQDSKWFAQMEFVFQ